MDDKQLKEELQLTEAGRTFLEESEMPRHTNSLSLINNGGEPYKALHGIIIPDNVTNGDVIKTLFSDGRVIERDDGYIEYDIYVKGTFSFCILLDDIWWNAPYKGAKE